MRNSLILMMMGLSDLGNSILAKPEGLQEGVVMQGESDTGQRSFVRLLGGWRSISSLCRGLVSAGPPVLLAVLAECVSPITEQCPAKGLM